MGKKIPSKNEIVIGKVTDINPHSAFVNLNEYNIKGMVHISEIKRGWIKDIKNHLKKQQQVVCKVVRVDKQTGYINLSIKRVSPEQAKQKIKEVKMQQKAERLIEMAAKEKGINKTKAYNEIGKILEDKFGSLYEGFNTAVKNPKLFDERKIPKEWKEILINVAEKNIQRKDFEFRKEIMIKTFKQKGVDNIKKILGEFEKQGIRVNYISAPRYRLFYTTKNPKKGEKDFENKIEKIVNKNSNDFEISVNNDKKM